MRGLLAGVMVAAALSLVAACGGSSSSSATPTPLASTTATSSPSPTAMPVRIPGQICRSVDLYGAFVLSDGTAGTIYYELGVTNVGALDCILVNPPALHFRDASGSDLGVVSTRGTDCPAQGPYDPANCVDEDAVDLPAGAATPAAGAVPGQLTVTIAVAFSRLLCPNSPAVLAHFIGLRFTGLTDDVLIELPNDINVQTTCQAQVRLHGYGPAKP
ncbi:MAG TPA: hypothetical protein VIP09_13240 [Dehalococcoidia bacterium]